jgi:hypothetical protein
MWLRLTDSIFIFLVQVFVVAFVSMLKIVCYLSVKNAHPRSTANEIHHLMNW